MKTSTAADQSLSTAVLSHIVECLVSPEDPFALCFTGPWHLRLLVIPESQFMRRPEGCFVGYIAAQAGLNEEIAHPEFTLCANLCQRCEVGSASMAALPGRVALYSTPDIAKQLFKNERPEDQQSSELEYFGITVDLFDRHRRGNPCHIWHGSCFCWRSGHKIRSGYAVLAHRRWVLISSSRLAVVICRQLLAMSIRSFSGILAADRLDRRLV